MLSNNWKKFIFFSVIVFKNIIETSENSEYDTDIKIIQENSGSLIKQ